MKKLKDPYKQEKLLWPSFTPFLFFPSLLTSSFFILQKNPWTFASHHLYLCLSNPFHEMLLELPPPHPLLSHDISTFIPSPFFEFSLKVPLLMNEHLHYASSFQDLMEYYNHISIFNSNHWWIAQALKMSWGANKKIIPNFTWWKNHYLIPLPPKVYTY